MLEDGEWESGGIADCGLRIADCGLRIDKTLNLDFESTVEQTHKSAIRNPQSAIPQTTDPRMLMGTLTYLSPEQARGEKVDHRTDIFSLGVVLYEMIAGTRPFGGETPSATLDAILNQEPEPVVTEHPGLESVIERSLAKDREARYQTAREMQADLQRLAQEP